MLALIRTAALAAVIMLLTASPRLSPHNLTAASDHPGGSLPRRWPRRRFARVFASALQARVGQPIVVDNRAGGGTMVGVMGSRAQSRMDTRSPSECRP